MNDSTALPLLVLGTNNHPIGFNGVVGPEDQQRHASQIIGPYAPAEH